MGFMIMRKPHLVGSQRVNGVDSGDTRADGNKVQGPKGVSGEGSFANSGNSIRSSCNIAANGWTGGGEFATQQLIASG